MYILKLQVAFLKRNPLLLRNNQILALSQVKTLVPSMLRTHAKNVLVRSFSIFVEAVPLS